MTRNEAAHLLRQMARPFNVKVDSDLMEGWWNSSLSDTEFTMGSNIVAELIDTSKFMPKPAEFNAIRRRLKSKTTQPLALPEETEDGPWVPNKELSQQHLNEMREKLRGKQIPTA